MAEQLFRTEVETDLFWIDAYSDGMCGSVTVLDTQTDETYRQGWSVTSEISSQTEALAEVVGRVLQIREDRANVRPEDGATEPCDRGR